MNAVLLGRQKDAHIYSFDFLAAGMAAGGCSHWSCHWCFEQGERHGQSYSQPLGALDSL